jgi:hypothetical protein
LPGVIDRSARFLGYSRAALGALFLVRTTPLSHWLPEPVSRVAAPLLGWPDHGFRAAWWGIELSDGVVIALCVARTIAAALFAAGLWTRAAGTAAAATALGILSQDAFGFRFTLYTLFVGTWLLATSGAGHRFALRPSPREQSPPSPWRVRAFVASVYAWAGIAKLTAAWLTGETLRALYASRFLTGGLADVLFATPGRCRVAAWGVAGMELLLAPLLLVRSTRRAGLVLAAGMHAAYECTAQPDVFGWVMGALLLSLVGDWDERSRGEAPAPRRFRVT